MSGNHDTASDDFRVRSEKHLAQYIQEVTSIEDLVEKVNQSTLIARSEVENSSSEKQMILMSGFPFDEGTFLSGGRIGAEKAPQEFRRAVSDEKFLVEANLLDNLEIYDIGDLSKRKHIEESDDEEDSTTENELGFDSPSKFVRVEKQLGRYTEISLEEAHFQQRSRIGTAFDVLAQSPARNTSKLSPVFFLIGGSGDFSYSNAIGLKDANPSARIGVIAIDSMLDVKEMPNGKCSSRSQFFQLLESQKVHKFIAFGTAATRASHQDVAYIESKGATIVWLDSHIRRGKAIKGFEEGDSNIDDRENLITQAGKVFAKILRELESEVDIVFVSLDMQAINAAFVPGVSYPQVTGGLSDEEVMEIVRIAAKSKQLQMFDVSEYSPAIELKRTRKVLANVFFEFVQGILQRNNKNNNKNASSQ